MSATCNLSTFHPGTYADDIREFDMAAFGRCSTCEEFGDLNDDGECPGCAMDARLRDGEDGEL